jgi:hypothetical protein
MESVYSAVRTESLHKADYISSLKGSLRVSRVSLYDQSTVIWLYYIFDTFYAQLFLQPQIFTPQSTTVLLTHTTDI